MKIVVNERIRELRKSFHLTQSDLAKQLNTTQDTVSLWECGKSYPDLENVAKMCEIFQVTADYLIGFEM